MKHIETEESTGWRIVRYTMYVLASLALILLLFQIPHKSELNSVEGEIKETNLAIAQAKAKTKKDTAIRKDFNLTKAEKTAQSRLTQGIKLGLGGCQNAAAYDKQRPQMTKLVGSKLTKQMYKMNGSSDMTYDLKPGQQFKFLLTKNTQVSTAFNKVTDVHNAKILTVVNYQETNGQNQKPKFTHTVLIAFDYDLLHQQVRSSEIITFRNK